MVSTGDIASFAANVTYDRLPENVREATKRQLLDAVGAGIRSRGVSQTDSIYRAVDSATGTCGLWGSHSTASAADAAMANAAAIESGHGPTFLSPTLTAPSSSIAAVLAVAESNGVSGEETLAGLATAFEIHGELAWNAPLDGFHPATHGTVAATAGVGRTIGLTETKLAHAIGTAASRVTVSIDDKGFTPLVAGLGASSAIRACSLARGGVEAPDSIGASYGWHDLFGPFNLDFDPGCERVFDVAITPYDAHPYGQSTIEAAVELTAESPIDPADIERITVETFEEAVPTLDTERIAAALVDRELFVYRGDRIHLEPIVEATEIVDTDEFADRVEDGLFPVRITVQAHGGTEYEAIADRFDGHPTTAASWGTVEDKFRALSGDMYDRDRQNVIVETARSFEAETATELVRLLD